MSDADAPCPICRTNETQPWAVAHDVEYRTSEREYRYWRCGHCNVLFLNPAPVTEMSEIYPSNYYSYANSSPSIVHRVKDRMDSSIFRRILRRLPGDRLKVLDVGGGDGWLLTKIRAMDRRVVLTQVVDIDRGAEAAALRQGHEYFCGLIEDFETDTRFDLVLMLNIIEHVADPAAVLARVRATLAPNGSILLKTPNTDSWDARIFRDRDWGGYHCPRHWVLFDGTSIMRVAQKAGLDVGRLTYTQGAPFWAVSVLASLARRGVANVTADRPMVEHPLFAFLSGTFAAMDLVRSAAGAKTSQMFLELTPISDA
jgi:2-polyprenyl-3-methyl-5-hydroxy-6-metoxy-1,4-benzoquinol methylase